MPDEWRATCVRATSLAAVTAVVALGRVIATRAVDARQRSIPDDEDARERAGDGERVRARARCAGDTAAKRRLAPDLEHEAMRQLGRAHCRDDPMVEWRWRPRPRETVGGLYCAGRDGDSRQGSSLPRTEQHLHREACRTHSSAKAHSHSLTHSLTHSSPGWHQLSCGGVPMVARKPTPHEMARHGWRPLRYETVCTRRAPRNVKKYTLASKALGSVNRNKKPIARNTGMFSRSLRCARRTRSTCRHARATLVHAAAAAAAAAPGLRATYVGVGLHVLGAHVLGIGERLARETVARLRGSRVASLTRWRRGTTLAAAAALAYRQRRHGQRLEHQHRGGDGKGTEGLVGKGERHVGRWQRVAAGVGWSGSGSRTTTTNDALLGRWASNTERRVVGRWVTLRVVCSRR